MNKKILYAAWGGMFAFCAALGFLPDPRGLIKGMLTVFSILFFLPPALLVRHAWVRREPGTLRLVRNLCICSLSVTLVLLIAGFATVRAPLIVGDAVHVLLVLLSSPMACGQSWVIGLGLWAALMWTCILLLGRLKHTN